jgi:hypothetical protein
MPDREFIHTSSDVTSTLVYALDSGLNVRLDEPQSKPVPCLLTREEIVDIKRGVFFLFRPEWVYGPFPTLAISTGYNAKKYSISPNANCSAVGVYFQGERMDEGRRRLGDCTVSWYRDWLEMPQ